jgi:hypothetical protein
MAGTNLRPLYQVFCQMQSRLSRAEISKSRSPTDRLSLAENIFQKDIWGPLSRRGASSSDEHLEISSRALSFCIMGRPESRPPGGVDGSAGGCLVGPIERRNEADISLCSDAVVATPIPVLLKGGKKARAQGSTKAPSAARRPGLALSEVAESDYGQITPFQTVWIWNGHTRASKVP